MPAATAVPLPYFDACAARQTAFDLFARGSVPATCPLPWLPSCNLAIGEALEICGEPGTGKTALLVDIVVGCILPSWCDGKEDNLVLIDTEGGFDVLRLSAALQLRLEEKVERQRAEREVDVCLGRLQLMRCLTTRELVLGLCALHLHLDAMPTRRSSADTAVLGSCEMEGMPRLLLLDSISAFRCHEIIPARVTAAAPSGKNSNHPGTVAVKPAEADEAGMPPVSRWLSEADHVVRLLRQRMALIWTRNPLVSHEAACEFPIIYGSPALTGLAPTQRLRMRLDQYAREADNSVHLRVQTRLDAAAAKGSSVPPLASMGTGTLPSTAIRHNLRFELRGVTEV